jgi:hypothetical protein
MDVETCELTIKRLVRERQKILCTGKLSAAQDRRLDEIEAELEYWEDMIYELEGGDEDDEVDQHQPSTEQ